MGIKDFWPEVFYYCSEKLPLSQKLRYFRGSRFSQCFILSTALVARYMLIILSNYQTCTVPLNQLTESLLLPTAWTIQPPVHLPLPDIYAAS